MFRTGACLAAMLLAASLHTAAAQTTTAPASSSPPPASTTAKPSKTKLTMEKLKEMKAKSNGWPTGPS